MTKLKGPLVGTGARSVAGEVLGFTSDTVPFSEDPAGGASRASVKRARLREGLRAVRPFVAVGAHDALTARLIEAYRFDGVWVSGLGVSTMALGLPDINLMTMTEALESARRIDAVTSLPVLADCDNGFGGLNNVIRTVQEYERAGIAGVCVEDNEFPKINSLYRGSTRRELVPITEQVRRIRAAKAAQADAEFVFVARVEALIAGWGVDHALERSNAYADAGADAILIHSRDRTLVEIKEFLAKWSGNVPLVAVPTLFPDATVDELHELGIQMVIMANQAMRAAVRAIEETLDILHAARTPSAVDSRICDVDHLFELVGTREAVNLETGG